VWLASPRLWPRSRQGLAYGYQIVYGFVVSGRINFECHRKNIPLRFDPGEWSREDIEDLTQETVARASGIFRDRALVGGEWSPDGGASMATYFVGTCVLSFAAVYRAGLREKTRTGGHRTSWAGQSRDKHLIRQTRSPPPSTWRDSSRPTTAHAPQ
jgi:hypothetical protein